MRTDRNPSQYTMFAILLHWGVAAGIIALCAIGLAMVHLTMPPLWLFQAYQLHKSIGITVLFLTFIRLAWRLSHRPPDLPREMPAIEKAAAKAGHLFLYVMMFALPLSGWAVVSASAFNIPTVVFGVVPWPHLPIPPGLKGDPQLEGLLKSIHSYAAWAFILVIVGHAGAALRHHFLLRDDVLRRILGARQSAGSTASVERPSK